jgi:hypothetical protein
MADTGANVICEAFCLLGYKALQWAEGQWTFLRKDVSSIFRVEV